jgi:hypothetical protein
VLSTKTPHFRQSIPPSVFSIFSCSDSLVAALAAPSLRAFALNRLPQSNPVTPSQTISLALTMRGKSMEVPVHQPFTHHPMKLQTETSQTQSNLVKPNQGKKRRVCMSP